MPDVTVTFDWLPAGQITLDQGLRFPPTPEQPGLYRLEIGDEVYIGETDRLTRRLQHYRTPGPRQATNIRNHHWLCEALNAGLVAHLSIVLEGRCVIGGVSRPLRLDRKADRVLAEHAALLVEQAAGRRVRNALQREVRRRHRARRSRAL